MPFHFLIPENPSADLIIHLGAQRSHYLCNVLRKRRGEEIECFDGHGTAFVCRIEVAHNRHSELLVTRVCETEKPAPINTGLALSLIKGQAFDRSLRQATELGATDICILQPRRSNVRIADNRLQSKELHWQKVIQAAAEQCGRLHLPNLHPPCTPTQFIERNRTRKVIVFDQTGEPLSVDLAGQDVWLLIGPEGGWDDSEIALFVEAKARLTCLAEFTLRAETAPSVALGQLHYLRSMN